MLLHDVKEGEANGQKIPLSFRSKWKYVVPLISALVSSLCIQQLVDKSQKVYWFVKTCKYIQDYTNLVYKSFLLMVSNWTNIRDYSPFLNAEGDRGK